MSETTTELRFPNRAVYHRALDARDPRFDGIFFVGITTTRIYCRPVCPARVSYPSHRRFFDSPAAAERDGFRPCLRCRPELAPGRALIDAVSRLACAATHRIRSGALNGRSVADLARELHVSERHLRRALEREVGVSPVELAQTHRLLLAKRLLTDTDLTVSRVAYASGFQSLRRFNAAFRDRYRMSPSDLRRSTGVRAARGRVRPRAESGEGEPGDLVRLTLAYRRPLAWEVLLGCLAAERIRGVEVVHGRRFGRTIRMEDRSGVVLVEDAGPGPRRARNAQAHLDVDVSASLLPVLMPLIARLRQLFDLDAEPQVVDGCLAGGGLADLVERRPGLRIPGAIDGFEVALRTLLRGHARAGASPSPTIQRVVESLGEPVEAGVPGLTHLVPGAERIVEAGAGALVALGVPQRRAKAVESLATAVADERIRLEPGSDPAAARAALLEIEGIGERIATTIVARGLAWPDAFPAGDRVLARAAGVHGAADLRAVAEAWRPWRAYGALHLRLAARDLEPGLSGANPSRTRGATPEKAR